MTLTGDEQGRAGLNKPQLWQRWSWAVLTIFGALSVATCSPLRTFNALMPKDAGSKLLIQSAPYGSDPRQTMDIYAPTTAPSKPLPIIVFLYGGSWNSGTKAGYSFVGRALAAQGFVVAVPDYRLVPQVRYPAFLEDNAVAVQWMIHHAADYNGNPQKVVLAGHSAGAYNAAMLAYDPRWLGKDRQAVRAMIGLAGPYDFLPSKVKSVNDAFGGISDPASSQPINRISGGGAPALLSTGDKDTVVFPVNSDKLAAKLRAAGGIVERKTYPALGHVGLITSIAKPLRGKAPVLDDMAAFAHKYGD